MDKATLVERDLAAGKTIVEALDRQGIGVDLAAWLHDDERATWRLLISSPRVASHGARPVYEILANILRDHLDPRLDPMLDDIVVASPDERIVSDLKNRVGTDHGLYRIRLHNARVYRAIGETVEYGAKVRIKDTGQLGTVRGIVPTPHGKRYLVLHDLTAEQLRPLHGTYRPPVGQDYAEDELDFLYVVRTGGGPDRVPQWVADATGVPAFTGTAVAAPPE